jgi:hypothetical protein
VIPEQYQQNHSPAEIEKLKDWFEKETKTVYGIKEECTCDNCPDVLRCSLAYDLYNTCGDCLLSK